jgi:hypothetical protein
MLSAAEQIYRLARVDFQIFCRPSKLRDLGRFEVSLCFICRKVYPERLEARISKAAKKLKITQR